MGAENRYVVGQPTASPQGAPPGSPSSSRGPPSGSPGGQPFRGLAPPPPGVVPNFDNPASLLGRAVLVELVFLSLAFAFVLMRIWTRVFLTRFLGWDDYFCIFAMVLAVIYTVASIELLKYGVQYHSWEVLPERFQNRTFFVWNVVGYMAYIPSMGAIKLSILFLYLRVFLLGGKLKIAIYALMAFVTAYVLAGELSLLFGCRPVKKIFNQDIPGECVNIQHHILSQVAFNFASDLFIVIAPFPTIWKMNLPIRQKLEVVAVFGAGLVACGISAVRLSLVADFKNRDFTWLRGLADMWSLIELNLAIICSCTPSFKPFLRHIIPRLRQLSKGSRYGSTSGTWPSRSKSSGRHHARSMHLEDQTLADGSYVELGHGWKNSAIPVSPVPARPNTEFEDTDRRGLRAGTAFEHMQR